MPSLPVRRSKTNFPAGPSVQQIVYADSAGGINGESKLSRTNSDQIAEGSRMPDRRRLNGVNDREEEKSFQFHAQAQSDSSSISGLQNQSIDKTSSVGSENDIFKMKKCKASRKSHEIRF